MCEREKLIKIPLVVHNPKLACGTSVDDHSSLGSRVYVTLEDDEPNSVKHVQFRNMRINAKLASILFESSKECGMIQSLSLWNTGDPFSDPSIVSSFTEWFVSHQAQSLSVGASVLPVKVFDDIIGLKTPIMSVYDIYNP